MIGETLADRCRRGQAASSTARRDRTRQTVLDAIGDRPVSTVRLIAKTGLSKSTVRRHLNALVAAGAIEVDSHPYDKHIPVYTRRTGGAR